MIFCTLKYFQRWGLYNCISVFKDNFNGEAAVKWYTNRRQQKPSTTEVEIIIYVFSGDHSVKYYILMIINDIVLLLSFLYTSCFCLNC